MTHEEFQNRFIYNHTTDRLGEGGFGEVFKAYDTYRDRWVAVKMAKVKPELEAVRLKREVEMVNKLPAHPNIAYYEECHTFSSFAGEYDFGILQYYEAGNLQQLVDKNNLTISQKENLLKQLLDGIGFLHEQGIIHRDLKPANILIVKRGDEYIPKITDFGISKKLDINKSSVFNNSLAGAGTLSFASPEQLGGTTIRKNTDLWSFGVIAYWLLSGELPFNTGIHGNTSEAGRAELFSQIAKGTLPQGITRINQPWRKLLVVCLETDSEKRVRNVEECNNYLLKTTKTEIDKTILISESTKVINTENELSNNKKGTNENYKKNNLLYGLVSGGVIFIIAGIFLFNYFIKISVLKECCQLDEEYFIAQPIDSVQFKSMNIIVDSIINSCDLLLHMAEYEVGWVDTINVPIKLDNKNGYDFPKNMIWSDSLFMKLLTESRYEKEIIPGLIIVYPNLDEKTKSDLLLTLIKDRKIIEEQNQIRYKDRLLTYKDHLQKKFQYVELVRLHQKLKQTRNEYWYSEGNDGWDLLRNNDFQAGLQITQQAIKQEYDSTYSYNYYVHKYNEALGFLLLNKYSVAFEKYTILLNEVSRKENSKKISIMSIDDLKHFIKYSNYQFDRHFANLILAMHYYQLNEYLDKPEDYNKNYKCFFTGADFDNPIIKDIDYQVRLNYNFKI